MVIGVLGLAGGVGRTTLAKALAKGLDAPLYELDVGYPKLWPQEEEREPVSWRLSRFERQKCDLCGECVKACQFGSLVEEEGRIRHRSFICYGCGLCKEVCPQKAIVLKEVKVGEIVKGRLEGLTVYAGHLLRRAFLDGVVVKKLKEKYPPSDKAVLKAPYGLHGEALRTVKEAMGLVLVVGPGENLPQEVKLFGEIVQGLGLPGVVIANRAEGSLGLETLCPTYGLSYAGSVPELPAFEGDLFGAWPEAQDLVARITGAIEGGLS